MHIRSGIILVENNRVALIERHREQQYYFLFPGGGVEAGETAEQAAIRETREELGLDVRLGKLIAVSNFGNSQQLFFEAAIIGGTFGTGTGDELHSNPDSINGSYQPMWLQLSELNKNDVRPRSLANALATGKYMQMIDILEIFD